MPWLLPPPLTHRPDPAVCTGSDSPGHLWLLHHITKLPRAHRAVLKQINYLELSIQMRTMFCAKACSPAANSIPYWMFHVLLSCRQVPHPERQNSRTASALEFRHLNYLNFFKLCKSLWTAGLFTHIWKTSWWRLLKSSHYWVKGILNHREVNVSFQTWICSLLKEINKQTLYTVVFPSPLFIAAESPETSLQTEWKTSMAKVDFGLSLGKSTQIGSQDFYHDNIRIVMWISEPANTALL